jgi:hypothetical protein
MSEVTLARLAERCAQLESRLDALQAQADVRERVLGAARALDRLDRDLLRAQFWEDASVDYGRIYQGPVADFVDIAMGFQGSMRDTQHFVGNVAIEIDGDEARAESYVHAHHVIVQGDERVQLMIGGRYLDRLERRAGEWRIVFRTELLDWGRWLPMTDRWFEDNAELEKGLRGRLDASYGFLRR